MANWLELPQDLLELITSYLSLSDVNRFSAVCQSWRFIAKKRRYAPVPQLPWVVLTEDPETRKRKLFNMSEQRHYYIDLPELRGGYCVGSSFGWLFIVSPKIEGYLVNPFTGVRYLLPPLPLYSKDLDIDKFVDGKFESVVNDQQISWNLKLLQKLNISKAVLSDDPNTCGDFVTIIIVRGLCKMAFCRPKDKVWTIVSDSTFVDDVMYYKENFYTVGGLNMLYAVDLGPQPKMRMIKPWIRECITGESRYLVDYFGKHLLLVYRNKDNDDHDDDDNDDDEDMLVELCDSDEDTIEEEDDAAKEQGEDSDNEFSWCHNVTNFFVVFELDLEKQELHRWSDLEKEEWHRWNDLGGNALFLGTNRAIAVRASEFPGCKDDCIYFTSDTTDVRVSSKYGYDDVGVYNLIEDSMEKFYEDYIRNTSMPTWLDPNP